MNKNKKPPVVLAILDGWGVGPKDPKLNAIEAAKTPFFDKACKEGLCTKLQASGKDVGLEDGQMSGSEAGHLNIGAGRVVKQDVRTILESVGNGSFFYNPAFLSAINHAKAHNSNIHLMGLMGNSDSPHAHPDIALALLVLLQKHEMKGRVFLHLFADGRDSSPKSANEHWSKWKRVIESLDIGELASVSGRFYGMDRAKNWDRLMKSYDVMVYGKGRTANNFDEILEKNYLEGNTDEYIEPTALVKNGRPVATIGDSDSILFFNFRSDRARQISKLFVGTNTAREKNFPQIEPLKNLFFVAMTNFGPDLNLKTAFSTEPLMGTLPAALGEGLKQLYISETEKFAHVTYFINGGYPDSLAGEERVMISSPVMRSYADKPEMSSEEVTEVIEKSIEYDVYDFIAVNFANTDMVAHTGDFTATVKAAEAVDDKLERIYAKLKKKNGILIITSDHGNADVMIEKDTGKLFTYHTKNPVPFIILTEDKKINDKKILKTGKLANIAPTILDLFSIEKPTQMTAESLLKK